MRPIIPAVVLLLCSCTGGDENKPRLPANDSAQVVTELTPHAVGATGQSTSSTVSKLGSKNSTSLARLTPSATSAATLPKEVESRTSSAPAPLSGPQPRRDCGYTSSIRMSDVGIGSLAVGRTVAAVKDSCHVVRDISELSTEGTAERVLTILIGGDTVKATVVDGLIWRIGVNRSRFATPDGFRVGTPLSRFVAVKGVAPTEGEDGLYLLLPSHCGLSFRFAVPSRSPKGQPWTASELASRHGSSLVNRILITRCTH